jgi:hypothetical protein
MKKKMKQLQNGIVCTPLKLQCKSNLFLMNSYCNFRLRDLKKYIKHEYLDRMQNRTANKNSLV